MTGYGRGNLCRCEKREGPDFNAVAVCCETGRSPKSVGLAGIAPAVPVVVGSQLPWAAVPIHLLPTPVGAHNINQ